MPCRSDYMEPTHKERLLQETAQLLMYVREQLKMQPSPTLKAAANNIYCTSDYVSDLCHMIRTMPDDDVNRIVYDARNPQSRKLANWWEKHQEADRKRESEEEEAIARQEAYEAVIMKLSDEEIAVLKDNWGVN